MAHPARGRPWSVRELADAVNVSHGLLGYMVSTTSKRPNTASVDVAQRIAVALHVPLPVLFYEPHDDAQDGAA